jgi:hypothetical protein
MTSQVEVEQSCKSAIFQQISFPWWLFCTSLFNDSPSKRKVASSHDVPSWRCRRYLAIVFCYSYHQHITVLRSRLCVCTWPAGILEPSEVCPRAQGRTAASRGETTRSKRARRRSLASTRPKTTVCGEDSKTRRFWAWGRRGRPVRKDRTMGYSGFGDFGFRLFFRFVSAICLQRPPPTKVSIYISSAYLTLL